MVKQITEKVYLDYVQFNKSIVYTPSSKSTLNNTYYYIKIDNKKSTAKRYTLTGLLHYKYLI